LVVLGQLSVNRQEWPVFFDPKGRRGTIVTTVTTLAWAGVAVLFASLLATSIWGPSLPSAKLAALPRLVAAQQGLPPGSADEPALHAGVARRANSATALAARRYAHFVNWDDNSFASLKRNARHLDAVIVEWLHLGDADGSLGRDDLQKEALVRKWVGANAPALALLPVVNNFDFRAKRWDGERAAAMLASPEARARFIDQLHDYLKSGGHPGLVLDFERLPRSAKTHHATLVEELGNRLRAHGLQFIVSVPPDALGYDHARLASHADALILMAYDEHFEQGEPGPLAGQGWYEAQLARHFNGIDRSKLIVGVGSYGYDWKSPGNAREVSVQEAWELLEAASAPLRFDEASLNPTFTYLEEQSGQRHQVWFLDGVTAYNQIAAALAMRPAGLALWRLGTEDPSVWAAFARGRNADDRALEAVAHPRSGYDVLYKGTGEVLRATGDQQPGVRKLRVDAAHNLITGQEIVVFPSSTVVSRWGATSEKIINLTFDDGPDPTYTPAILDILAQKGVKATFFIVGSAGTVNRDLLRRIHAEGHDIGNHTFTHTNLSDFSHEHLKFELNATQRLLESTIGVRTKLFRPPFGGDLEPQTIDGADALRVATQLGYLTIGMRIDPKDWARPLSSQIVAKTVEGAIRGDGNVVLLHDAGGNRTATIEALPQIIDRLRAEGFRFVTTHELIGLSREQIMPRVDAEDGLIVALNYAGFSLFSGFSSLMAFLFQLGIALGTLRMLWVATFAVVHRRREKQRWSLAWAPDRFAVIVPAHNEERVICGSVSALLASEVSNFEILVVDDGSRDRTAEVVREAFAGNPRVRVITKPNGGKWSALNMGLAHTDAEVVVTLDADTIFEPDAPGMLLRHFADPKVGAVAGCAGVGNRVNLLTRFQALEYATNQNLDRRALELVNGITVVPGAIGAWRRSALLSIGGFVPDTLAEDADATTSLAVAGWKIAYEPRALARTEAPETLKGFMGQRMRWMFGTLQMAYKHRRAMLRIRPLGIGAFGLPNIVLFQFLFTLAAPFIDLMLVWSIVSGLFAYALHPEHGVPVTMLTVAAYWAYFQLLEVATSGLAIALDRRRNLWRLLPLLFLQRFCYRQLLYVTAMRVAAAALKGRMLGWGSLARTGRVLPARAAG
jgi:cellulose synthase/poly-beta-1,6-N-acetylglucosamine synthase-like glycosyltransferase/peptidoglycan/xylan/chitin deacetylase (PgdA/CDA1 family)